MYAGSCARPSPVVKTWPSVCLAELATLSDLRLTAVAQVVAPAAVLRVALQLGAVLAILAAVLISAAASAIELLVHLLSSSSF
jgi:hypothetical protein